MKSIQGEWALVTGAGSGIGRATALALAEAGARVVVCDVDPEGLAGISQDLGEGGLSAEILDVGDRAAFSAFAGRLLAAHGPPGVVVNNAGVGVGGGMLDTPLTDWDWLMQINLWGVVHGCHFFAPAMADRGRGHIVNVASMLGYVAFADTAAYCASKFAVRGLSEALRAEMRPHGVGVSVICPGMIRTNIVAKARLHGRTGDEQRREAVLDAYVKRDYGPERVASAILRAIRKDLGIVPVTPEARVSWWLSRAAPSVTPRIGKLMERLTDR